MSSAQNGCELCRAIKTEFFRGAAIDGVNDKVEHGLNTSVRIYLATCASIFPAEQPDVSPLPAEQFFDRLFVCVGEQNFYPILDALSGSTIVLSLRRHKGEFRQPVVEVRRFLLTMTCCRQFRSARDIALGPTTFRLWTGMYREFRPRAKMASHVHDTTSKGVL